MLPGMAISTTKRKTGRPQGYHRTADGIRVDGLTRRKDGRWRVSATGQLFTEPDEKRAIDRFMALVGQQIPTVSIDTNTTVSSMDAGRKQAEQFGARGFVLIRRKNGWELRFSSPVAESAYWSRVRKDLIERPLYSAAKTGIEQVAYLGELKRPADSPKLAELIESYSSKPGLSRQEQARSRVMGETFVRLSGAASLEDITHATVTEYEKKLATKGLAPKSVSHFYSKIKTIIAYALKRGTDAKECRRALDVLGMLITPKTSRLAPSPISKQDFWAVYGAARKSGDTTFCAMMFLALNAAMYGSEAAAVRWDEVDLKRGELVTNRNKTGVPRVAVLWPETVRAIKALPHQRDTLFLGERRSYTATMIWKKWNEYREAAGTPAAVQFSSIRDGSYTQACRTASQDKARILAGHRLPGAMDNYVQRNPQFVAEACRAIHTEYFPAPRAK